MKKDKKKLLILVCTVLLLFTGCTKRFTIKDADGKNGKSYTQSILCRPEEKELQDIYIAHEKDANIKYDKLPACTKFKVTTGGYEGLWTSIFVKPLAWLVIKVGVLVKNYGLSIMIIGILLRAVLMPFSKKSTMMSENMKKAKPELDRLEKKYANKTNQASTMMKSQEMMAIYKKYSISPLSGCLFAFLQLPIFFAFLEAVYRVPVLFEGKFLMFNLGATPLEGIKAGNYWYIILIVLIIGTTYFSMKNMNTAGVDDTQAGQMQMMTKFMIVFIAIASFSLPTAIALYWIVSSGFTIIQNLILTRSKDAPKKAKKLKKVKVLKNK